MVQIALGIGILLLGAADFATRRRRMARYQSTLERLLSPWRGWVRSEWARWLAFACAVALGMVLIAAGVGDVS